MVLPQRQNLALSIFKLPVKHLGASDSNDADAVHEARNSNLVILLPSASYPSEYE